MYLNYLQIANFRLIHCFFYFFCLFRFHISTSKLCIRKLGEVYDLLVCSYLIINKLVNVFSLVPLFGQFYQINRCRGFFPLHSQHCISLGCAPQTPLFCSILLYVRLSLFHVQNVPQPRRNYGAYCRHAR